MESRLNIAPDSDFFLSKHELKPLFETLIIQHLMKTSQTRCDFEAWYAQLDIWDRRIIQSSQLKEYLISIHFIYWDEISNLIPGLEMGNVIDSSKPNRRINTWS